jgi:hypothetical protein
VPYTYQVPITFIIMLLAIAAAIGPFLINGAMEFTKWLTSVSTTGGKRFLLALLAIVGAIAYSGLNGTPLDVKSLTSLGQVSLPFWSYTSAENCKR